MDAAKQNYRIQKWICGLSVVLFIVKIFAWYLTNSVSILSDALESIVNVMAGFIGLYSLYVAAKPRDTDHPYGHGKAEFISAAAEGALVIGAGILIIYQTIINLVQKSTIESLDKGLILVVITAVVNYVAGYICIRKGRQNNSLALQASGRHLQVDTYSTIGIVIGLLIIYFTKIYWLDKAIAFGLGIMVMFNGYHILRKSLAGIMDEADMNLLRRMVDLLEANRRPNWIDIHNLRVIKYGALLHVDCHLTLPWYLNLKEAHKELDIFSERIISEFGDTIEMFVHYDDCRPAGCPICTKSDCPVREHPFKERLTWNLDNILTNEQHTS
ncbi:MAG TPA: cation diffusion facilitator family transporter [Arachidicoccus sp.]|nr:cation diffusion facilitator family transporter [Arachidicoccus sp.]